MGSLDTMTSLVSPYPDNPFAYRTHSYCGKSLRRGFHSTAVLIGKEVYEASLVSQMRRNLPTMWETQI